MMNQCRFIVMGLLLGVWFGVVPAGGMDVPDGVLYFEDTVGWDIPMPEVPDVREEKPAALKIAKLSVPLEQPVLPEGWEPPMGIHQEELLEHHEEDAEVGRPAVKSATVWNKSTLVPRTGTPTVQKQVVGWHPYWGTSAQIQSYDYSKLTTIAYFSYEVNPTNGGCITMHDWATSPVVEWAHSNGVKVVLTATLFESVNNELLLTNETACNNLIDNLLIAVSNRGGDGVCIDFENVGSWSGATKALTTFMSNLTVRFHRDLPGSEVSIALPAVDWHADFDVAAYEGFGLDYAIIMGYDYYYAGSSTPGPVAPLYSSAQWIGASSWCSVDYSIRAYLGKGISTNRLLLGVPYYGRQWRAESASLGAASLGSGSSSAKTYVTTKSESATYGRKWDSNGSVPYYTFTSGGYTYQCFYEDVDSLELKYNMVNERDLGGIGIWNLTQGHGADELWELIGDKFSGEDDNEPEEGGGDEGTDPGEGETSANADWVAQTSAHQGGFYGVGSRDGLHVAVGADGAIYTSEDGMVWAARDNDATGLLMNVNGAGPLWMVVGADGVVLTSTDGLAWVAGAAGTYLLRGIAYGNDAYVVCGDGGSVWRSVNGVDWAEINIGTNLSLQGISFGSGYTGPNSTSGGLFVIVGQNGLVRTSPDGLTWTAQTSGTYSYISDVIYGNGYFVGVGPNSLILRSADGETWTQVATATLPAADIYFYRIEYCAGVFKAVGAGGHVWSSADGLSWTQETTPSTETLRGISYANDQFVAVGFTGTIMTKGHIQTASEGGDEGSFGEPGEVTAAAVADSSLFLEWKEVADATAYEVQLSTDADFDDSAAVMAATNALTTFIPAEGWVTNSFSSAVTTNVNGADWILNTLEVRPEMTSYGNQGYIYLNVSGSYITTPAFPGTVTQVVTTIRAAAASNWENRKVTLGVSVNGGASFTDLDTYTAYTNTAIITNVYTLPSGYNGGTDGVMFRLLNVSSGTGPTVLIHDFNVYGTVETSAADSVPGHGMEYTELPSGPAYYARVRAANGGTWTEALSIPLGIQPRALAASGITSNNMELTWTSTAASSAEYTIDVSSAAFQSSTVTCPSQTLGFSPGSAAGWYYEGETVTDISGAVKTGPVYHYYDSVNFGQFLVGTNNQSLLSDAIALNGADAARVELVSGAWNANGDAETTRINVYYRVDDKPWNWLGTQVSTSLSDGGSVSFNQLIPAGALDGTNLYVKIVAPNARAEGGFLRGAYVNTVKVSLTGGGGQYSTAHRVAGYPRRMSSANAILPNLQPSTRYYYRVQTVLPNGVKSVWTSGSAVTTATDGGGQDPGDETGSSGLPVAVASQPRGALSGVTVFCSGGHGFGANSAESSWIPERPLTHGMNEDMGNLDQLNYFAIDAWKAGATVVPFRPVGYQTNEVVLDNVDTTQTTRGRVTFSGSWVDTSQTSLFYGSSGQVGYRWATISVTGSTATAEYRPVIPAAGEYPVYTWVRHGSDRADQLYRIHHTGGIMEVRVNHRQVGNGWVWLGNYYFEAGTNGCVVVDNYAPDEYDAGNVVIADAIRFGNGMGNVSRGTAGISGFEQELESSRFWVIKSMGVGMASTLYDISGSDDRTDNIGQPARWANNMCRAEGGERWQRIYVGFHSNAGSGAARGTWGLYDTRLSTNAPTYYKAQTNLAMQLVLQARAVMGALATNQVIDAWSSGRIYGSSYGEIYNASIYNKMDTTINETGFHDNEYDAAILKNPAGREGLARATTYAIIQHLGVHYSASTIPLIYAPDRPVDIRAANTGTGRVTLSWAMPARTGGSGGESDGFTIYTSADGKSFGNPISVEGGSTLSHSITGLVSGATVFFRVCAVNEGGESLHSSVAGVRVADGGAAAGVLLVGGYTRNNNTIAPTRYFANGLGGQVALVRPRMINDFNYASEHGLALAAAGESFDYMDASLITSSTVLSGYDKVVWILGRQSVSEQTFTTAARTAIAAYLNTGGRLMVSGSEIGYDLGGSSATTDTKTFLTNSLRATFVADSGATGNVTGRTGGILDGVSLTFNYNALRADMYMANYPDVLGAGTDAQLAAVYGTSTAGASGAVVQYSNEAYRTVVMGFPFETITDSSQRATVMARVMDFFNAATTGAVQVNLSPVEAVTAGAQWRLDGGAWQNTGTVMTELEEGSYTISFADAAGYLTPGATNITIMAGETNVVAVAYELVPADADTDGNGLPDAWEITHFGRIGIDPDDDADDDGMTNREEYIAGTDPRVKGDRIFIAEAVSEYVAEAHALVFEWPSKADRTYALWHTDSLMVPTNWNVVVSNITATPPANRLTNVVEPNDVNTWFYRIGVTYSNAIPAL